ncbi:condensation domain-containing protein, partial [Janthinobacterium sp. SUN211]|uniref:condensation domain-containing protein n=1 Tax=Janthinobacterium sp. SUN211 TaxID=3014786 RepID=UPI002712F724
PGVIGEIYIGGASVARGYLNLPALTAERFLQDPFRSKQGSRLYKTGDLGRWLVCGNVEFLGRNDHQVKIRGFRIELGEIEHALQAHAQVRDTVVLARDGADGDKRLVAYVVPLEAGAAQPLLVAALRQHLVSSLPDYMVPQAFVVLERLPLTPNGKVDRKALPEPDAAALAQRVYEAPCGEVEQVLADIWHDLLKVRVGRHDHFFELGGHSLLAVQVMARLRQALQIEIALRHLFTYPVLSELATCIAQTERVMADVIPLVDRGGALPLSWSQQRLWFLAQLDDAASAAYHMPAALRLSGRLDRAALKATLDRIVARHESLRTTFVLDDGQPMQHIAPAGVGFALAEQDISLLDVNAQELAITRIGEQTMSAPFDLSRGPLIRGQLLRLGPEEHILFVNQHHIITDGWSIGLLVREVSMLYTALSQGRDDPLPPLPLQYADYAVWQRAWLQGDVLQAQVDYWQQHLAGAPALLALPLDRQRPEVQSYRGASAGFSIPATLTQALKQLG